MEIGNIIKKIKYFSKKIINYPFAFLNSLLSKKFKNIYLISDYAEWATHHTTLTIYNILKKSPIISKKGYDCKLSIIRPKKQYVFYGDQYSLTAKNTFKNNNIISFDYQHGLPNFSETNKKLLELIIQNQSKIKMMRVTNSFFKNFLIESGIPKNKIMEIPLSIDKRFYQLNESEKFKHKELLNIPKDKFIIGSFQKDGNGWGKGLTPKLIKGPDIFLKSLEIIKKYIPNLFVLLTGPARGYVKDGLNRMGIEYKHFDFIKFDQIPKLYNCLNLYLVCSRDEGGPYSLLESMACGVPIISTKVGMAHDLIENEVNGFVVDVEDYKKIAEYSRFLNDSNLIRDKIIKNGLNTISNYSSDKHKMLWENFFKKLIQN